MRTLAFILLVGGILSCASVSKPKPTSEPFALDNLIPWSIVAYDSQERSPAQRVQMIKKLGFSQYAFGGRHRHVKTLPKEIQLAKANDITISAVWLYLNHAKDAPGQLRVQNEQVLTAVEEAGITPQLWVGFNPKYFEGLTEIESFDKAISMISYLATRAADLGCTLGLYNHGGWMGRPDNQLKVLQALDRDNIGIVYNFHHGHGDLSTYQELFPKLLPHLLCVNLNGMEKDGEKILPIGMGDYERDMIRELQRLNYTGPWGILGHVRGGDAKEVLEKNLAGLHSLDKLKVKNQSRRRVFLFAGQSNMDGRANAEHISAEDVERLQQVQDRIAFHYNRDAPWPLQPVTPKPYTRRKYGLDQCFGPELFFGINMVENNPQDSFIFIKRAQGGTSLHGCWNPYWTLEKATLMDEAEQPKLFADFISYTKDVIAAYEADEYQIEGLLWVQGEDDSSKKRGPIPAEQYYTNLKNLLFETRSQLNVPSLPMYIFQVGSGKVVEGMKRLAAEDPNVYFIPQSEDRTSADFYEKNPPPIGHYTAKSMKKIGQQFYQATVR